eukprot:198443-Rhodomonas_salina.1
MPGDRELGSKIKRVVAVSIFGKKQPARSLLHARIPWLTFHAWATDEIERRFCMRTEDNKTRGGVEFVDINLQALVGR